MAFVFVKKGDNVRLFPQMPSSGIERIPPKIYKIRVDDDGIFLEPVADNYVLPKKIYTGRIEKNVEMIVSSYTLDSATGALMTGPPGSGKSLTTEIVCNMMLAANVPVIWVSSYMPVDLLRSVVAGIGPCVVNFEEFSKSYGMGTVENQFNQNQNRRSRDDLNTQMDLLSFFSDTTLKGVLFLLSENDSTTISPFILCRPGRVKYHFRYFFDSVDILNEMSKEFDIDPDVLDYARAYMRNSSQCNIDVIKTVVAEMAKVKSVTEFAETLSTLNVPPPVSSRIIISSVCVKETKDQRPFCVNIAGGVPYSFNTNSFRTDNPVADLVIEGDGGVQTVIALNIEDFRALVPKEDRFKAYIGYKIDIGEFTVFFRLESSSAQAATFHEMGFADAQFTKAETEQAVGGMIKKQYTPPQPRNDQYAGESWNRSHYPELDNVLPMRQALPFRQ